MFDLSAMSSLYSPETVFIQISVIVLNIQR